ncbi:MAG: hypothetical protein WA667_14395 [Candidatus Nitrosopolaris sp.]
MESLRPSRPVIIGSSFSLPVIYRLLASFGQLRFHGTGGSGGSGVTSTAGTGTGGNSVGNGGK